MSAPVGGIVRIVFDVRGDGAPKADEVVRSTGGSMYKILESRPTARRHRFVLTCLKLSAGPSEVGTWWADWTLQWNPRRKKYAGNWFIGEKGEAVNKPPAQTGHPFSDKGSLPVRVRFSLA